MEHFVAWSSITACRRRPFRLHMCEHVPNQLPGTLPMNAWVLRLLTNCPRITRHVEPTLHALITCKGWRITTNPSQRVLVWGHRVPHVSFWQHMQPSACVACVPYVCAEISLPVPPVPPSPRSVLSAPPCVQPPASHSIASRSTASYASVNMQHDITQQATCIYGPLFVSLIRHKSTSGRAARGLCSMKSRSLTIWNTLRNATATSRTTCRFWSNQKEYAFFCFESLCPLQGIVGAPFPHRPAVITGGARSQISGMEGGMACRP